MKPRNTDTLVPVLVGLIAITTACLLYVNYRKEQFQAAPTGAFSPVSSYNAPYMKPSAPSKFVEDRKADTAMRPVPGTDKDCKGDIQPFITRKLVVNLGNVKPHYIPGTTKADPTYKDTLAIINQFRNMYGTASSNPNCRNTFLRLLYFITDTDVFFTGGNYTGQGIFASLSQFQYMLPAYMNFQIRPENAGVFAQLESVRKAFRLRVGWFAGVFDQKKDNKYLLRTIPEIFIGIIDGDVPRLEYIKSQLLKVHMPVNYDVSHPVYGFVRSEQERYEHTSGYNGYYTIFLLNIMFIYQCLGMFDGFEKFETHIRKIANTMTDPSVLKRMPNNKLNPKNVGLFDTKYKEYYKNKAVFDMDPVPINYSNYIKAYTDYIFRKPRFQQIDKRDPYDLTKNMDLISFDPVRLYNIIKQYNSLCLKNIFKVPEMVPK